MRVQGSGSGFGVKCSELRVLGFGFRVSVLVLMSAQGLKVREGLKI
jgi:hypothetical protein